MSEHDLERLEHKQQQQQQIAYRAGGDAHEYRPNEDAAATEIEQILKGHGDVHRLPQLVSFLDAESRAPYLKSFERFGKVEGDIALECALNLSADPVIALSIALKAHPKATRPAVRRYLDAVSSDVSVISKLANADATLIKALRGVLPGPLGLEVPSLAQGGLQYCDINGPLLRWFVETTPARVCANAFGTLMTKAMAETLDKEKLWGWVDVAVPTDVQQGLAEVIPSIGDAHARTRLQSLASGREGMGMDAWYADAKKHTGDMHAVLATKPTLEQLYEAAGRANSVDEKDRPKLLAELTRLRPSADDVLSFSAISGIDAVAMLQLLLHSPGVTAQHVTAFLGQRGDLRLLSDAKTRAAVRQMAPDLDIHALTGNREDLHEIVVDQPGLLAWYLEGATPKDLLWLCARSTAHAAKGTRIVKSKVGLGWVRNLPAQPEGKDAQLRILLLNCHDEPTETYIREYLLGEVNFEDKVATKGSLATDPATHAGAGGRLVDAVGDWGTPEEVIARLRDLDPAMRTKLGADDQVVETIANAAMTGDKFAHAARLLGLTFESTLAHSPQRSALILGYLDTRAHGEQLAALGKPDLVKRAAEKVHQNLLLVFPALSDPNVLAAALTRDGGLLELLLAGSDPSRVATLLGSEPARTAAAPILRAHPGLVAKLPRYKDLSGEGKHGVDELESATPEHSREHHKLEHERKGNLDGDKHARAQGRRIAEARKAKTLVEAIETLGQQHEHATGSIEREQGHDAYEAREKQAAEQQVAETNALAILEEHKSEVRELLTDRSLHPTVKKLEASIDLPPNLAIPWITAAELARMPNAVTWWMSYREPAQLLRHLDNNQPALLLVVGGLNTGTMGALQWLERLPKGFELDSMEDRVIEQLRPLLRDNHAVQALFHARFGVPPPGSYTAKQMNDLWTVLGRLPPNHIKQERISAINEVSLHGTAAGQYSPPDHRIDIDPRAFSTTPDTFYAEDRESWYTRDQLKVVFGYDDARIDQLLAAQRFETKQSGHDLLFRQKEQSVELFTQVVLHEVGHSVDDILGNRTPPVFDYAGWHAYSDATFDAWAAEMGGWDRVSAGDKHQIRDAWLEAARGHVPVKSLVDSEHPAVDAKYATVGIVKAAREGKSFDHTERVQIGDRVFVAGSYIDSWYSVKASAAASAPSDYSLYAPAEYFAESYVEYYRGVDGSPGSQARKGGALPGPVRQWFDANVDKLKYDPLRFKGGASDQQSDAPQQAKADNKAKPAKPA